MPKNKKEKKDDVNSLVSKINKKYGNGSCFYGKHNEFKEKIDIIPTPLNALNMALGVGGFTKGRTIELMGVEGGGKTALSLQTIGLLQKNGGRASFIDAEHALNLKLAKVLGVDTDSLLITTPGTGEEALDILEMQVRSGLFDLIVVDSVAALTPQKEIDGEMGDTFVALQARMMSQAMRKLNAAVSKTNTCVIFINQLRDDIGKMFGDKTTSPGGKALKYYSSVRINIKHIGKICKTVKDKRVCIGHKLKALVVKNKLAPNYTEAEFNFLYNKGLEDLKDVEVKPEIKTKEVDEFE